MSAVIDADKAIGAVGSVLAGLPAYIAGSSAASAQPHAPSPTAYSDIDVFFSSESGIIAGAQRLLNAGFTIDQRHQRVWYRWLKHGLGKWHTHSLKLSKGGIDANLVFKIVDGHATTSAAQVIESFDFGLLAHAFDLELMDWRDMRSYLFPRITDLNGPLPLLPLREASWKQGFISQYQGLREVGRYIRYVDYGWDLSLVKPVLVDGYLAYSEYKSNRSKPEDQALGKIALALSQHMQFDEFNELRTFEADLPKADGLDQVLASLE